MFAWFLLPSALAEGPSVRVLVEGEEVAVHHGAYCSFPRLAGVTTETSGEAPSPTWDVVFDSSNLSRGFSGLVRYEGEEAVGAHPLAVETDLKLPGRDPEAWSAALGPCRLYTMEGAALPELLRKLGSGSRTMVVRSLVNEAVTQTSCGASLRTALLEEAFACGAGRCEPFVLRLEAMHSQRCD